MEIVLNRCFGGFCISEEAAEYMGLTWDGYGFYDYRGWDKSRRTDPKLIRCVKELKEKANGRCADLEIVTIPDGINWYIDEFDGIECVREYGHCWPREDER